MPPRPPEHQVDNHECDDWHVEWFSPASGLGVAMCGAQRYSIDVVHRACNPGDLEGYPLAMDETLIRDIACQSQDALLAQLRAAYLYEKKLRYYRSIREGLIPKAVVTDVADYLASSEVLALDISVSLLGVNASESESALRVHPVRDPEPKSIFAIRARYERALGDKRSNIDEFLRAIALKKYDSLAKEVLGTVASGILPLFIRRSPTTESSYWNDQIDGMCRSIGGHSSSTIRSLIHACKYFGRPTAMLHLALDLKEAPLADLKQRSARPVSDRSASAVLYMLEFARYGEMLTSCDLPMATQVASLLSAGVSGRVGQESPAFTLALRRSMDSAIAVWSLQEAQERQNAPPPGLGTASARIPQDLWDLSIAMLKATGGTGRARFLTRVGDPASGISVECSNLSDAAHRLGQQGIVAGRREWLNTLFYLSLADRPQLTLERLDGAGLTSSILGEGGQGSVTGAPASLASVVRRSTSGQVSYDEAVQLCNLLSLGLLWATTSTQHLSLVPRLADCASAIAESLYDRVDVKAGAISPIGEVAVSLASNTSTSLIFAGLASEACMSSWDRCANILRRARIVGCVPFVTFVCVKQAEPSAGTRGGIRGK